MKGKKTFIRILIVYLSLIILGASLGLAGTTSKTLRIGTKEAPPFSMKGPDGAWSGISIDLWDAIAEKRGLSYKWVELPLNEMINDVAAGKLDGAIAALSITSERERKLDFSHPFYNSGLGIGVPVRATGNRLAGLLKAFFSLAFLQALLALLLVLLAAGVAVWFFERKKNSGQFGGKPLEGLGSGFWWSAVTMTTVGYGDKSPVTLGGRIVGLIWMFTSIIIISGFTATIASSLTVGQLESQVRGPEDLPGLRVAAVKFTTASDHLQSMGVEPIPCGTVPEAMQKVADGQADAVVHDAPMLQFLSNRNFKGKMMVLPRTFVHQDYGIAIPQKSPLREPLNATLLQFISTPEWEAIKKKYLGS